MKKEIFTISNGRQAEHTTTFEGKALTSTFMHAYASFSKELWLNQIFTTNSNLFTISISIHWLKCKGKNS